MTFFEKLKIAALAVPVFLTVFAASQCNRRRAQSDTMHEPQSADVPTTPASPSRDLREKGVAPTIPLEDHALVPSAKEVLVRGQSDLAEARRLLSTGDRVGAARLLEAVREATLPYQSVLGEKRAFPKLLVELNSVEQQTSTTVIDPVPATSKKLCFADRIEDALRLPPQTDLTAASVQRLEFFPDVPVRATARYLSKSSLRASSMVAVDVEFDDPTTPFSLASVAVEDKVNGIKSKSKEISRDLKVSGSLAYRTDGGYKEVSLLWSTRGLKFLLTAPVQKGRSRKVAESEAIRIAGELTRHVHSKCK